MGEQRRLVAALAALTVAMMMVMSLGGCAGNQGAARTASGEASTPDGTRSCVSNQHCPGGAYCTTEDGVCNLAPGCKAGQTCAAVCHGACSARRMTTVECQDMYGSTMGGLCSNQPSVCEQGLCALRPQD